MHVAPIFRDHEFPNVKTDVRLRVFFDDHVVGIGAAGASDFGVDDGFVHFGGKRDRGDDVAANFSSVVYNRVMTHGHLSFTATLKLNPALQSGNYRLFVCGTTSIENLAGIKLNNGSDAVISFTVARDSHKDVH